MVARAAGLLAVAVLPLLAGLTGAAALEATALAAGFRTAMVISGLVCAAGGIVAALTIRNPDRARPPARARRALLVVRGERPAGAADAGGRRGRPGLSRRAPRRRVGKGRPMPRSTRTAAHSVFAPAPLGPITLRNRIIKAATFEGVTPGGVVSDELIEFHRRVAAGGAAMSTVAYLAVSPEGRTDRHCLLLDEDTVPGLRRLTDAVHAEGAAAAAQIGHAGPVANARSNRAPALSPSGGFTPMGSRLHAVDVAGIERITEDYRRAAALAVEAGFDCIEVHVGHNYLLSAFLSPKLNRRDDQFGGSVENRARFARGVLRTVRDAAGPGVAVTAKLNMADGVDGGLWLDDSVEVARLFEADGALDALELTGGSSLANPMYLFRGDAPLREFGATLPPPVRLGFRVRRAPLPAVLPLRGGVLPPLRPPVPQRAVHAAHPPRRHHRAGHDRGGAGRGLRLRRHGPGPLPRARPAEPHGGGHGDHLAVHPLQQVHADDLLGHALRAGDGPSGVGGRPDPA